MKFKVITKNNITNTVNKQDMVEASDEEEARQMVSGLYSKDIEVTLRKIIRLRCYHVTKITPTKIIKCGYEWDYSGARTKRATCPDCTKQVYIERAKV